MKLPAETADHFGDRTVDEAQTLTLNLSSFDSDGDKITYSAANLPTGAVLNQEQGILSWTPTLLQSGNYTDIELVASNGNLVLPR